MTYVKTVSQALRMANVEVEVPMPPFTIWRYLPSGISDRLKAVEVAQEEVKYEATEDHDCGTMWGEGCGVCVKQREQVAADVA